MAIAMDRVMVGGLNHSCAFDNSVRAVLNILTAGYFVNKDSGLQLHLQEKILNK